MKVPRKRLSWTGSSSLTLMTLGDPTRKDTARAGKQMTKQIVLPLIFSISSLQKRLMKPAKCMEKVQTCKRRLTWQKQDR